MVVNGLVLELKPYRERSTDMPPRLVRKDMSTPKPIIKKIHVNIFTHHGNNDFLLGSAISSNSGPKMDSFSSISTGLVDGQRYKNSRIAEMCYTALIVCRKVKAPVLIK